MTPSIIFKPEEAGAAGDGRVGIKTSKSFDRGDENGPIMHTVYARVFCLLANRCIALDVSRVLFSLALIQPLKTSNHHSFG